jgi:membrane fusion protein (multidrug efflux system)
MHVLWILILCLVGCKEKVEVKTQAPLVSSMIVQAQDVPVNFHYVAQTQSSQLVNIQARVSGFLDKRVYTEGELVKEGQVLFLMDKKPFQVQVDAAEAALKRQNAALENSRLNLDRAKPLAEQNALSKKDLDDATSAFETAAANVEQFKAQLQSAILNLSYCTITSPLDGVASSALQQEGSYVSVTNSQLTTVAALDPIWVNFSLSENDLLSYRNQQAKGSLILPHDNQYQVKVILGDGSIFPHVGKITFAEPYFNPSTGTFLIRASVDNPEGHLRPNQFVRVDVEGAVRPKAILIPQTAVQQSAKGPFVWVINKEGKADFRPVTLGDWHEKDWFISEGLHSGEEVITGGSLQVRPGEPVRKKVD